MPLYSKLSASLHLGEQNYFSDIEPICLTTAIAIYRRILKHILSIELEAKYFKLKFIFYYQVDKVVYMIKFVTLLNPQKKSLR